MNARQRDLPPPNTPALELSGICKRFGGVVALQDVSFVLRPGTVHALLGENGAGKTTLMHVAYGVLRADSGVIRVSGAPTRLATPLDAISAGIGMVHQHFTLVPTMTVAENLALGGRGRLRAREITARARAIGERIGFALNPDAITGELPVGAQQRVEIAKALSRDARVLVLDEPTAVLAPAEIDELLRWLRLYVQSGNAAVLITHKLREAVAVADDVTVLRRGRVVSSGPIQDASVDSLTRAMIGAADSPVNIQESANALQETAEILRVDHVSVMDRDGKVRIRDASFVIRAGELIGIAAVEGAGQRELLRALALRARVTSGTLSGPSSVGFVPEDRHRDAVLLNRSLTENMALAGAGSRRGRIDWSAMRRRTAELMGRYDVRALGPDVRLRDLSGGNQQRLVLAREVSSPRETRHTLLVVENPTRGLDVRATAAVHEHLRRTCAGGGAVVMYSSDLDEMLSLASRVLVVFDGRVQQEANDRGRIGRAMVGLPSTL